MMKLLFVCLASLLCCGVAEAQTMGKGGFWGKSSSSPHDFTLTLAEEKQHCETRPTACVNVGDKCRAGKCSADGDADAAPFYKKACDAHVALGCQRLAELYARGFGVEANEATAKQLYRDACVGGAAIACRALGAMCANDADAVCKDCVRANCTTVRMRARTAKQASDERFFVSDLQSSCTRAPKNCYQLAAAYRDGSGVIADQVKAQELYKASCEADEPFGCGGLAEMIEVGATAAPDLAAATALYERACAGKFGAACSALGRLKEQTAVAEAKKLYEQACDAGDREGCWGKQRLSPKPKKH